jgi:hypothetical protein
MLFYPYGYGCNPSTFYLLFPVCRNQDGLAPVYTFNAITLFNETVLIISQTTMEKLLRTKNL